MAFGFLSLPRFSFGISNSLVSECDRKFQSYGFARVSKTCISFHRVSVDSRKQSCSSVGSSLILTVIATKYDFISLRSFFEFLGGPAWYVHFLELVITCGGDRCSLPHYVNAARLNRKNRSPSLEKLAATGEVQRSCGDLLSLPSL